MKKNLLLLLAIFMLPTMVFAKEDSVLYDKLYKILGEDGKLKITDISTLDAQYLDNVLESEEPFYDMGFSRVVTAYIYSLPEVQEMIEEYEDENPAIAVYCKSKTNCGIDVLYDSDQRGTPGEDESVDSEYPSPYMKHYDVEIEVDDKYDKDARQWLLDHFTTEDSGIYKDLYLYDLSFINQLYNQNNGIQSLITGFRSKPTLILRNFPEIKTLLADNADFQFRYAGLSNLGAGWTTVEYITSADFISFYKDKAYLMNTFVFHIAPVLFVDENVEDDKLIDAAKERIQAYLNDEKVKVVIDDITPTFDENELNDIYADLDNFLGVTLGGTHDENTRVYSLKIGNTLSERNFFIIRTKSENIKDLEIDAIERKTGIRFNTNSALVPVDSELEVDDVTSEYANLNSSVEKAFDINIYSEAKGAYLKDSFGTVKIYIPVEDDYKFDGKQVAYLSEDGEVSEKIDAELVTVNGKKYLAFDIEHLSVYGIIGNSATVENPKTSDNVQLYIYTFIISSICLLGIRIYKKQYNN